MYQRYAALRSPRDPGAGDGLPLPPPRLRVLVAGSPDPDRFLRSGALEAAAMRALLQGHGIRLEETAAILDFGCGCGRITRHWTNLSGPAIFGCDYNPELVAWCRRHLPSVRTETNGPEPPLPFARRFDFIYAISVFTHLSEPLQFAWMNELLGSLSPGGVLLFTTVGERGAARLSPAERERFESGELVVRFDESSGRNLCAAFHPPAFVRRMAGDLELVETVDTGLPGVWSASPLNLQDTHLVRAPAR